MIELFEQLWAGILQLGVEHNVSPVLFAILYVLSIPPYMGSMVWAVRNHKKNKAIALPVISTLFFFILPALYVLIFGENVAWWVYALLIILVIYSTYTVIKKIQNKLKSEV
jgi:ABC-type Co2+ transport system permease subunit